MEYLGYDKEKKEYTLKVSAEEFWDMADLIGEMVAIWPELSETASIPKSRAEHLSLELKRIYKKTKEESF